MRKKYLFFVIVMLLVLTFGCSHEKDSGLILGKYGLDKDVDCSWVILDEDNTFQFNRGSNTSYRPSGTYSIDGNRLTLTANKDEVYIFKIQDGVLVFESGKYAESLLEVGSVFNLVSD